VKDESRYLINLREIGLKDGTGVQGRKRINSRLTVSSGSQGVENLNIVSAVLSVGGIATRKFGIPYGSGSRPRFLFQVGLRITTGCMILGHR
jgi:hypothetical protein